MAKTGQTCRRANGARDGFSGRSARDPAVRANHALRIGRCRQCLRGLAASDLWPTAFMTHFKVRRPTADMHT